jgi:hypothetical protein
LMRAADCAMQAGADPHESAAICSQRALLAGVCQG